MIELLARSPYSQGTGGLGRATVRNHTGPTKDAPELFRVSAWTSVLWKVFFLKNKQQFAHADKIFWVRTGCSVTKAPCEGFSECNSAF